MLYFPLQSREDHVTCGVLLGRCLGSVEMDTAQEISPLNYGQEVRSHLAGLTSDRRLLDFALLGLISHSTVLSFCLFGLVSGQTCSLDVGGQLHISHSLAQPRLRLALIHPGTEHTCSLKMYRVS